MSVQQFCLRWNNHQSNFISVCSSLLHNGALVDVTLAAEGKHLQAHKIVLSTCSSYFQALFTANPCQHPIVILKDVQYNDLKTMVDFMYYGEVNVSQEQLPHILKTAEMLKIKGLADMPTDAATLTKSESKSSEYTDHLHRSGSGSDSFWDTTESQYQEQRSQQSDQHLSEELEVKRDLRSLSPPIIRRTRSAESVSPPATRRKKLRKSPNNGSTDETYIDSKIISKSHDDSIRDKFSKEFIQRENLSQDTNPENVEFKSKQALTNIRPDVERSMSKHSHTISHSRSLEITGTVSTSDHGMSSTTTSQLESSANEPGYVTNQHNLTTAVKRNRFLIRQPRVKRESDTIHQTASLDIKSTSELIEYDPSCGPTHTLHPSRNQSYQSEALLTVPPRIERHASEPLPVIEATNPHLLTVPSHSSGPPFLIKQHSHPLLPSQQAQSSTFLSVQGSNENVPVAGSSGVVSHSITRQLSHPMSLTITNESSPAIPSTGIGKHLSEDNELHSKNSNSNLIEYSSGVNIGNISSNISSINVVPSSSLIASNATATTSTISSSRDSFTPTKSVSISSFGGRKKSTTSTENSNINTSNIVPPPITKAHSSSVISLSESFFSTSTSANITSGNHSSPLRVKSEDFHRSVSSPLVLNTDPLSFECVSRSSHCPVIRPGPALGCNFCWNTIDAHGRILRRKTKYHCPECQTNLCIVPCFQEYHERQSTDNATSSNLKENKSQSGSKHHPKTESF